jgi:hypothetical protein
MKGDDPSGLSSTAASMAEFLKGKNAITSPWWAAGAAIDALFQIAADNESPLQEVATVATQVMASVYNNKVIERRGR